MHQNNTSFDGSLQVSQLGDILAKHKAPRPTVDASEAVDFLRSFDAHGRHTLVALDPSEQRPPEARAFEPGCFPDIAEWVAARSGRLNLYFHPNEPAPGSGHSKLRKGDVGALRAIYADLDPKGGADEFEAERARLRAIADGMCAGPCPPSIVTDSGSGFHLFWLLQEAQGAAAASRAEAVGKAIADRLGGDSVWNIDRIMRLPGTVNLPTASKRAKGRVPCRAAVVVDTGCRSSLAVIEQRFPPVPAAPLVERDDDVEKVRASLDRHLIFGASDYSELPDDLRNRFERHRSIAPDLDDLWRGGQPTGTDKSRSVAVFELAKMLKGFRYDASEYGALLWVWEHAVNPGEDIEAKIDLRTISRAWARAPRTFRVEAWFDPIEDDGREFTLAPAATKRITLIPFADAVATALDAGQSPLIKGIVDLGTFSVIYGESNVGKTFVALDMAFSVATGTPWSGRKVVRRPVVYIAAEGGRGINRRLSALTRKFPTVACDAAEFHLIKQSVNLLRADADLRPLVDAIKSVPDVGLVVIDTLSRALAGGDENSSVDMGHLVTNLDALRQRTGAHLMVIHHSGKNAARGARGHSLLRAALDTEIEIADDIIAVKKQRDLEGGFQQGFSLVNVRLGSDEDGDPITSCFVELVAPEEIAPGEATAAERRILEALAGLAEDQPKRSGFPLQEIVAFASQAGDAASVETVRSHLRALEKKRLISKVGRGAWLPKQPKIRPTDFFAPIDVNEREEAVSGNIGTKAVDDVFQ